jgi:hypothetical protein
VANANAAQILVQIGLTTYLKKETLAAWFGIGNTWPHQNC